MLPTARAGLVTAVLLGVARVIGETSPVLLVAGSTNELNYGPHSRPDAVPAAVRLHAVRMPLDTAIARAFGSSVVLLVLVVVLFGLARMLGGRPPGHMSRRKLRRLGAARARRPESEPAR